MLSSLFLKGRQAAVRCVAVKYQLTSTSTASTSVSSQTASTASPQVPAESSQRDLINFPRPVRPERPPPTRLVCIPESWFNFFYPKTGVTGPYIFAVSVGTYCFSKEVIVLEHYFIVALSFIFGFAVIPNSKIGVLIGEMHNKALEESIKELDESQQNEKQMVINKIKHYQDSLLPKELVTEVMKAKRENVLLQLEGTYRERLESTYKTIKRRLDYHVELQNVERRIAQKNLIDYVIRNVLSSITPEQEKSAMQNCISDLNALASKV